MADEPKRKKQKRMSDFFHCPPSAPSKGKVREPKENENPPSQNGGKKVETETAKLSAPKSKASEERTFKTKWLEGFPWLQYEAGKMTCKFCVTEGKDNPFTSGCTNFRHSTLLRHAKSVQHKAALECKSLRSNLYKQSMNVINKKNEAMTAAMTCVYWIAKEQIPSIKFRSLLELQTQLGCTFPGELQVGTATYTSSQSVEEMQDAMAGILKDTVDGKLLHSTYMSLLLDESCDISVTKKLLVYAKSCSADFDVCTHFIANVHIPDGKANTIYESVKNLLESRHLSFEKVVAIGSDGASVMTGSKNGFVALVRQHNSPHVIGVHCMAHRLALCSCQAAGKVAYLKEYQQILSDIFYHFKRSAIRREKVKEIQSILDEPNLQYKELHSVRWFSMYNALEAVYRTWGSLATYLETEMEQNNDSTCKGFFKKVTSFSFLAVTYMLMDIIPRVTELSLFFQKEDIDLAMVRPSVDSVVQQLTWLKTNDGHHLSEFMSVASEGKMTEFRGVKVTDTPVLRQQFSKVRNEFLTNLISEIERRFPAVATDMISNLAVLSLRGLSLLTKEDRQLFGRSQMTTLTKHFDGGEQTPFVDGEQTLLEWERCKDVVYQQHYPCHTVQSTWKLLHSNHPGAFPNLEKLAMVALLAPLQTATVERGFSIQNQIKVSSRNRLSAARLNTLMQLSLGPPIAQFDFAKAIQKWKNTKKRCLFASKSKS